ncbi:MAG: hypothetical protein QOE70_6706 [Chthoniobacter sp.]|nr:hypothetical protein [Chthoniobacter sp.]
MTTATVSSRGFEVLSTADQEQWNEVLAGAAQHDFYHSAQYHRLAEWRGEGVARLFVYREEDHLIALPLLVRPISEADPNGWKDATSIYGYSGLVASGAPLPPSVIRTFQDELRAATAEQRIVSVFSRLHPLIEQRSLLTGLGEIRPCGQTISIDLTLSSEAQRAQYSGTYRTRINKLLRKGVTCTLDREQGDLPEFVDMYHETMRRVKAHHSYFFGEDYFTQLAQQLGSALKLFIARFEGRVICGGLFTLCDGLAQYHLGATRDAFLRMSPMGLVLDTARAWATEQGARVLHLGGGVGSKQDSLFDFKAGFSKRRHRFETWQWVTVPEVHRRLNEERARFNQLNGLAAVGEDYFPAYRCPALPRGSRGPSSDRTHAHE